jgi:hypothetical protein
MVLSFWIWGGPEVFAVAAVEDLRVHRINLFITQEEMNK